MGKPAQKAAWKSVVETWQIPPPTTGAVVKPPAPSSMMP
jgi:hypothetical protein